MDDGKIIEDYRKAYIKANGPDHRPPYVYYRGNGWYGIAGTGERMRLKEIIQRTERLNERAAP